MQLTKNILLLVSIGLFFSFISPASSILEKINLVDSEATKKTKALYANLLALKDNYVLFGHQDALAYGVKWKEEEGRSDVKDVCGQYPAVFGWDISKLGKYEHNIDSVHFGKMKEWMKEVYKMGGVNTISWHMDNFTSKGSSWDTTACVAHILPGGPHHELYKQKLDLFADFIDDLKVGFIFKKKIPIIFRPLHEMTGHWFWWGKGHATPEEYKALWQFTVEYLRDEKDLHNLLYCFSTDICENIEEYMEYYPGDDYVDIMGMDDYWDVGERGNPENLTMRLRMLVELAEAHNKIPVLSETGFETIPHESWWTDILLHHIKKDPTASRIAYLLVWRNARLNHHYAPYSGHISAPNFQEFVQDSTILLESQLPKMYKVKRKKAK